MYQYMYRGFIPRQEPQYDEINVTGIGTEFVLPDLGIVFINITSTGSDAVSVETNNAKMANDLIQELKKFGIKNEDIELITNIVVPRYIEDGQLREYQGMIAMAVTFHELSTISEFFYNIRGKDITVDRIIITLEDPSEYYGKALQSAVINARRNADKIAETLERTLLPDPKVISETSDIDQLVDEIIVSNVNVEDIKLIIFTIHATVRAKFLVQ